MGSIFHTGNSWAQLLKGHRIVQLRHLCSSSSNNNNHNNNNSNSSSKTTVTEPVRDVNVYRQLQNLDFMTAAKILFTTPPKKKKFGIDFHLVQLFFACMPSLAVYLVAQYARYEMRRMEAEIERKKKQQAEEEEKQMEPNAVEESTEIDADPELLKVKVRLDALEEVVKEIVVEAKKMSGENLTKDGEEGSKRKQIATSSNTQNRSQDKKSSAEDNSSKSKSIETKPGLSQERVNGSGTTTNGSQQDQKVNACNGGQS